MKHSILILLSAVATAATAAPTLTADPYAVAPAAATLSVDAGPPIACTLPAVSGGVQPTCDLASITAPGTYTLVLTVTVNAACTSTLDAADCSGAGSASSRPFAYTWRGTVVPIPVLQVVPSSPAPKAVKR